MRARLSPRSLAALGACLVLAQLTACEQVPDIVLRTEALQDGGDDGGASGDGGMSGDGSTPVAPECDPRAVFTFGLLSGVARDGCRFEVDDRLVSSTLDEMFFGLPEPEPQGETRPPSSCDFGFQFAYPDPEQPMRFMILCPGYCTLLNLWLDENEQRFRECFAEP